MRASSRTVPGTGLSFLSYGLLVALSVALFLFWDGPLWTAKRDASHVARFFVSYMAVLPAALLALAIARRLSWSHLVAATGSAWGIKLIVTSALYLALARGTGPVSAAAPARTVRAQTTLEAPDYRAAKAGFERGVVRGSVVRGAVNVAGAVVLIDKPLAGLSLGAPPPAPRLTIHESAYDEVMYLARTDSDPSVASKDAVLHTLHLYTGDRAVLNVPVPPGAAARAFAAPEAGVYEARCDTHTTERATVVVADHPYVTRADESGRFVLSDVAVGPVTLIVVVRAGGGETSSLVRRMQARVEAGETTVVHIDLSTPEVAEERL